MNTSSNLAPYLPVEYSRLECRLFNLISRRTLLFRTEIGKGMFSVKLGFDGAVFPYQGGNRDHEAHLAFEAGEGTWQVAFQKTRALYGLMEAADGSGFFAETPPESLPEEVLWAVLEAFLSPGLARVEAALGAPVTIVAPVNPPAFDHFSLGIEIAAEDGGDAAGRVHGVFQIPLKASCVDLLETLLSGVPIRHWSRQRLAGLRKPVFWEAGRMGIPAKELAAMAVGDVLLPDTWYLKENRVGLNTGPDLYVCDYDEQAMAVTVAVRSDAAAVNGRAEKLGKEGMTEENTTVEEAPTPTGRLDLDLVFEVGRTTMTIDEIGQLSPGRVIGLSHKLDGGVPVEIKTGGQLIARGRIVGVGDGVGVQITETGAEQA